MPTSFASIKRDLDRHLGENITVVALAETFHSVFVVDLDPAENSFDRVSYSYADLLTKSIQLTFD